MLIDDVKSHPLYPFSRYFEDPNHFIEAQKFWLTLLRQSRGFAEQDWQPHNDLPDLPQAMYEGTVASIVAPSLGKAIRLGTTSVEGMAHMLKTENGPMTPESLKEMTKMMGTDAVQDRQINGLSDADALAEAKSTLTRAPLTCEVDHTVIFDDAGQPKDIERLVVVGQITAQAENSALQVFDLFLQPGPAKLRVHDAFPDPFA